MPISRIRTPRYISPSKVGKRKRIHIPQPEERPLIFRAKDVVRWGSVNLEPWWFTLHRRGARRPNVGEDPLEARAISKNAIRGTLPERIVYLYLVERLRFRPNIDFDFQSSLQGGRMELGGIVADFLFPFLKIIIQVMGPTHNDFLRQKKDIEQEGDLTNMGFRVFVIDDTTIYDEYLFEEWMRRAFGLANGMGGSSGAHGSYEADTDMWGLVLQKMQVITMSLERAVGGQHG